MIGFVVAMEKEANLFLARIDDLIEENIAGKKVYLPHKLNIRCRLLPFKKMLNGVRRIK